MQANRHPAQSVVFAMGLGAMVWAGQASALTGQPLAYVTSSNGITVIDTGDNQVVDTIVGPSLPAAVTPDGKQVYAFASISSDLVFNLSVINATTNQVVTTIPLNVTSVQDGVSLNQNSSAIAVSPDGTKVYVTTGICSSLDPNCATPESVWYALWLIDTATNQVVMASPGKGVADGFAFSPDGQHIYLTSYDPYFGNPQVLVLDTGNTIPFPGYCSLYSLAVTPDGTQAYVPYSTYSVVSVGVVDTVTNALTQSISIGPTDLGLPTFTQIAVTPNGKYVYVTSQASNNVTAIDTASNAVVKTVAVGTTPSGVAITPDGAHVYVSNQASNNLSVIDTASNTVTATVPVSAPGAISILPPPQGVQFFSFDARLKIHLSKKPNDDTFEVESSFTLNSSANEAIQPDKVPVRLQVGPFIGTFPIGSFKAHGDRSYTFAGVINGAQLRARIEHTGTQRYSFRADAKDTNLSGITNPVQISLSIGDNAGLTSVKAR
jgi:YVTN family beta-propeller protein